MDATRRSRATIVEVARVAGVSISSVSRALNGHTSNQDMIARVRRAADQVGYVPSAIAQSLKTQVSGQVAFAVEDVGNPAYLEMVRAIQPILRQAGLRLVLHSTDGMVGEELAVLEGLNEAYVDGLILCPIRVTKEHLKALELTRTPVVVIGTLPDNVQIDRVRATSQKGAAEAIEHLHQAGCSRIAFINGPSDTVPGTARFRGYQDGIAQIGQQVDSNLIRTADSFSFEAGLEATRDLLGCGVQPDGILGANDRIALGAIHALREEGLSVPDQVKVVGMDDAELAKTSLPPLTSVNLGAAARGRKAAELLLARLRGEDFPPAEHVIPAVLTVRESSR